MFKFGKRKDDDEEEKEEEDKEVKPKKKPRKKKEPKKPWGKKERIIVASTISVTILSSFIFFISSKHSQTPKIDTLPISTPEIKPVVLGKEDTKSSPKDEVLKALNAKLSRVSGTYGIEVIELSTGKNYGINQNEKINSISSFKLPLIISLYREKEQGSINFSATHILQESDKVGGSGSLIGLPNGTALSYKDLLSYMVRQNDNTAFNILGNKIGWQHIDELISKAGMLNTSFKDGIVTSYDLGLLLQKFMDGKLVSETSKKEIIDLLINKDSLIAKGVDPNIKVSAIDNAGIIFTSNPYVLVVIPKNQDEISNIVLDVSQIVYNKEKNQ